MLNDLVRLHSAIQCFMGACTVVVGPALQHCATFFSILSGEYYCRVVSRTSVL